MTSFFGEKMRSTSFLIHSQSFRTSSRSDNISELILLSYSCLIIQYMKFLFGKTFLIFDRLSIVVVS